MSAVVTDVDTITCPDEASWLSERMRAMRAMKSIVPAEARFWAKVEPEPNSGCWIWVGARNPGGYGVMGRGARADGTVLAHRFSYELLRGPIPTALEQDHLCRVRCCVNPWHLEPVTRRENLIRGEHPWAVAHRQIRDRQCRAR